MIGNASPYQDLGVRSVINASTTLTTLGGSLMPGPVVAAMQGAASTYVDIEELHMAAGRRIASLTNNEAAHVTSGCAAAIVLATLAAMTRGEPLLVTGPPREMGMPTEVIVDRSHDIRYLPALLLAGARIVWIGGPEATRSEDLDAAITEATAAVFYVAGSNHEGSAVPLGETIAIAHARQVPVIVDAAAQLPPVSNLWHFTKEMGADLVLFSGGKGLRGPQSSGLIVGKSRYVAACAANASPAPGIARALKVGKEEIVGLVRAIELYLETDHEAERSANLSVCEAWVAELNQFPGVAAEVRHLNEAGQPTPRVLITIAVDVVGCDATELRQRLWDQDPRIAVLEGPAEMFYITPDTLAVGDAELVLVAIRDALQHVRSRLT